MRVPYLSDRSRTVQYQRCPRSRWWGYHHAGRGIEPSAPSQAITVGIAVHKAMESALQGGDEERVVASALDWFDGELASRDIPLVENWVEDRRLVEALSRVISRHVVPELLRDYRVKEVEQEILVGMGPITWMSRPDAILESDDWGTVILSLKTAASLDPRLLSALDHDAQGHSEIYAYSRVKGVRAHGSVLPVIMLKGRNGQSPLLYYWTDGRDKKWSYTWQDEYGAERRVSRSWSRVRVENIAAWLDEIRSVQPDAGDPLSSCFSIRLPSARAESEVLAWAAQVERQETRVLRDVQACHNAARRRFVSVLNERFPQYTHSCHYPAACPFIRLCWSAPPERNEIPDGYRPRCPNHPYESQFVGDVPRPVVQLKCERHEKKEETSN